MFGSGLLLLQAKTRHLVVIHPLAYLLALLVAAVFSYHWSASAPQGESLDVLTYSSFSSDWGPGPDLKREFERRCSCTVNFINAGDANMMLRQLGQGRKVDLVLGLDQLTLSDAADRFEWESIKGQLPSLLHPIELEKFVPFDWAPMTLVSRKPIGRLRLKDIIGPQFEGKIALQDPRSSSPGLQFFIWLSQHFEPKRLVQRLKQNAHSVSTSWSTAYGIFQNGQADLVFSYTTSPVYHLIEEKKSNYHAVHFFETLPVQVEYVAILKQTQKRVLARDFIGFLLSAYSQKVLQKKNYMLPVVSDVKLEPGYRQAVEGFKYEVSSPPKQERIRELLEIWRSHWN